MKITQELAMKQGRVQGIQLPDILGTGSEYIWQRATKQNADANIEDSVQTTNNENVIRKKCVWTKIYGELQTGEYEFVLEADLFSIRIKFTIGNDGKLAYDDPELTV